MTLQNMDCFIIPMPCRHPLLINFKVWGMEITPIKIAETAPIAMNSSSLLKNEKKSLPPAAITMPSATAVIIPIFVMALRVSCIKSQSSLP